MVIIYPRVKHPKTRVGLDRQYEQYKNKVAKDYKKTLSMLEKNYQYVGKKVKT